MSEPINPELGQVIDAGGILTNCLIAGQGTPVMLIHGSGPGVTGWANWRLLIPELSPDYRVIAPDMVGFGYTARPDDFDYSLQGWTAHLCALMDALELPSAHFIGNSFGGALALAMAARYPERVRKLVLMGAAGIEFELTPGLDAVWGYQPSLAAMRDLMSLFAFDPSLVSEQIVSSRYEASIRPGYQESYSRLFPAPRQRHLARLATPESALRALPHRTLLVHGREDRIVPLASSLRMHALIPKADLHVFGE